MHRSSIGFGVSSLQLRSLTLWTLFLFRVRDMDLVSFFYNAEIQSPQHRLKTILLPPTRRPYSRVCLALLTALGLLQKQDSVTDLAPAQKGPTMVWIWSISLKSYVLKLT